MLISYNWLQSYFKKKLPAPEKLADILTFLAFEVEGVEKKSDDTVLDVKVLPDRAHYALSHRGIAREIAAALGQAIVLPKRNSPHEEKFSPLIIKIENQKDCSMYIGRRVEAISSGESPAWKLIRSRLEAIGQRSIHAVVDAANYVMFDMGQPLHAFDADAVQGSIFVRRARKGEAITTLDDRDIDLDPGVLIIADDKGPLGIAGIKGGKRAAVRPETKNLILEAAHFNPANIRKTSLRFDIRTDASKRFENEPPPGLTAKAIIEFSALIAELCPDAHFGGIVDDYPAAPAGRPAQPVERHIAIRPEEISERIGIALNAKKITEVLERLNIQVTPEKNAGKSGMLMLFIPPERIDLAIPEDIAEEVGRLIGYEKVPAILPPKLPSEPRINKQFYWEWKIREFLAQKGFSEVMTSSFANTGEVAIEKPIAADKPYLRANLARGIGEQLRLNLVNLPLLGMSQVKIFEIGSVFTTAGEKVALCVGLAQPKGSKEQPVSQLMRELRDALVAFLGTPIATACTVDDTGGIIWLKGKPIGEVNRMDGILELSLDALIAALPERQAWDIAIPAPVSQVYKPFSLFPFIVRDIAFFLPAEVAAKEGISSSVAPAELGDCIKKEAGPLARRIALFDRFEKNGKTSFAFRIVFQADDRTLTDEEANKMMEKVSKGLIRKYKAEIR